MCDRYWHLLASIGTAAEVFPKNRTPQNRTSKFCTNWASMATIRQHLPKLAMNYAERPQPWCVIRLQPNLQHSVLNRFQRRTEAEAHLKVLQQMTPSASYTMMFDGSLDNNESGRADW